jgi:hypothetical protein
MKRTLITFVVASLVMGLPAAFAAKKAPAASGAKSTTTPAKVAEAAKPLPMHVRADSIDVKAQTFITKRKTDGVQVKNVVTAQTEIKNGDAAATLADIKVGDYVSGSRIKKSDTQYEVVKITKFGPPTEVPASKAPAAKAK